MRILEGGRGGAVCDQRPVHPSSPPPITLDHSLGLLQTHVTNSLAIAKRLGRSSRGSQLDVLDPKVVEPARTNNRSANPIKIQSVCGVRQARRGPGVKWDSRLSDLHLGLQVEKGIGELFSLSEGRFDDLRGETEGIRHEAVEFG